MIRHSLIIEIVIIIIFLISIPIVLLIERNVALSDKDRETASAYMQKGDQFYNQGKFVDASVQYWKALKLDHKLEDAYFRLAEIYYDNLWNHDALNELQKLEKLNPNYKGLYLLKGKIYQTRLDDSNKALAAFQKVIVNDPQNAEAYYYIGTIYQQKNNKEDAILSYEKAVGTNANDKESISKSYLQLGRIYKTDGDTDTAIEILKKAFSINPNSKEIIFELIGSYTQKAENYKSEQKFDKALEIYKEIVKLDPDNPENIEFYMEIGSIYRSEELYDKAIEAYQAITKLDPLNFDAFSALKELNMIKKGAIGQ
ncbi:TPA: tetratricopeptide repeat protein [bacterium]|nr:tetratricopeptide repeat protein [bacterium]